MNTLTGKEKKEIKARVSEIIVAEIVCRKKPNLTCKQVRKIVDNMIEDQIYNLFDDITDAISSLEEEK